MSAKSVALVAGGIAVFAIAVYLFIQVRATPAQADPDHVVAERTPQPHNATPPSPENMKPPEVHLSRPVPTATVTPSPTPLPETGPVREQPPDETKVNLKMDNMMELANKAYDRQDFDEATAIAGKILAKDPTNIRMMRIMVSSNCIQGDSAIAQQYYEKLPAFDREQMRQRCDRYGVTFKEPPQ
ncbi:MAG TPA: hypothetical protein VL326_35855 [Kofleriaceae bacterium]|nr:hypothetical protein [Kofleriaceae bacterium]